MEFNRIVDSEKTLKTISKLSHQEGEVVFCQDTNRCYIWQNGEYQVLTIDCASGEGLQMTLYDLNKNIIEQLPVMDESAREELNQAVNKFHEDKHAKYYMLLCHERHYYTVFVARTGLVSIYHNSSFGKDLLECVDCVGQIKTYEVNDNEIEIWFTDDQGTDCMHLFPYDAGVVEFWEE